MNIPRACVPVCNFFERDSRVLRTCRFLKERGYAVTVLALGRPDLPIDEECEEGIEIRRFPLPRWIEHRKKYPGIGPAIGFATYIRRAVSWVRRFNPEVIHLNDWESVPIAALSQSFKFRKTIYDMHEFFQDRDSLEYSNPVKEIIVRIDRTGLRRSNSVICVSELIGQELRKQTSKRVHVVRNIPERPGNEAWPVESVKRILEDGRRHFVFLGGTKRDRGLNEFLSILAHLPEEFALLCLSPKNNDLPEFEDVVRRMGLTDRVTIHDVIPQEKLFLTLKPAYAGLSFLIPDTRKIAFALPNKLFEYLQAGIPVVCNDAPAQAELVTQTRSGLVLDVSDPDGAAARLQGWDAPRVSAGALEAAGLTWESEKRVLGKVYDEIGA